MDIYLLEEKRTELLAQCIVKDKEVSKDNEFSDNFNKFWQSVIIEMLQGEDAFFANFIVELRREVNYRLEEPMVSMAQYNYFRLLINPVLLLQCSLREIQALLKHEVYHILSLHHYRAVKLLKNYSKLAITLAMDMSVNQYIINLPNWANTIEKVRLSYNVDLKENETLEIYTEQIQEALNKKKIQNDIIGEDLEKDSISNDEANKSDMKENMHLWMDEGDKLDEEQLKELVNKLIENISTVKRPESINKILETSMGKPKLSWQRLLVQSFGSTAWNKKKTITRRDRRMPHRLDLRGKITHYISDVVVAIDISGSMTEKEIGDILTEIKGIVRNYNSKVTVLECDDEIRKIYLLKSGESLKERPKTSGKTRFLPVFRYIKERNLQNAMLIYFTDGLGEETIDERLIHNKTLWVITSSENQLSLKNPPGVVINLESAKENKEDILPLEFLKSEMKEIRSEWAK